MNRRDFIGGLIGLGTASFIFPSKLVGSTKANSTIQLACIGTGRICGTDMGLAVAEGLELGARIVALCDVDETRLNITKQKLLSLYKQYIPNEKVEIKTYKSYKELIDNPEIDGVIITTPDHTHANIAIYAARKKKDIYLEKPFTHGIREGIALVDAVTSNQVVFQTGTQQRSSLRFRKVNSLIHQGAIGKIQRIEVLIPTDTGIGKYVKMDVPKNLDYHAWLGDTKFIEYTEDRVHPQNDPQLNKRPGWLQVEQFCRGMITGWGSHMFDIAQWGLGIDHTSGPVEVTATGEFPNRGVFDVHTNFSATAKYANGVEMISKTSKYDAGVKFIGENGWMFVSRERWDSHDMNIFKNKASDIKPAPLKNHMYNFIDCMRTRNEPEAPAIVGHRSNTVCVLHHIAMKLGRKIVWNPDKQQCVNDASVNELL